VIFVPVKLSKALVTSLQLLLSALLLCAAPWAAIADEDSQLSRDLKLEAFPALQASEDSLRLVDVNHEHTTLSTGFSGVPGSQGLDLSSSYVWESARFGQFVVSTNTSYIYNTAIADGVRESSSLLPLTETAIGFKPERENSITFSWQIGNHTATAVTRHSDALDQLGLLSLDALNVDDLNELVGQITMLDLRYAYNVRAGRTGNASIALGVRNMFERKAQTSAFSNTSSSGQPAGNMAYGTIKYQF
jgi:hypothetical protein